MKVMPHLPCMICGKDFYAKPNWIKLGKGKYSSHSCCSISQKKGEMKQWITCGKDVYRSLRSFKTSKSGNYFCGKRCQTIWRNSIVYVGKRHPNWKGGAYTYRRLLLKAPALKICTRCQLGDMRTLA